MNSLIIITKRNTITIYPQFKVQFNQRTQITRTQQKHKEHSPKSAENYNVRYQQKRNVSIILSTARPILPCHILTIVVRYTYLQSSSRYHTIHAIELYKQTLVSTICIVALALHACFMVFNGVRVRFSTGRYASTREI